MTIYELISKWKAAESKEDVVALAKEVGTELTEEQVNEIFAKLETLHKDGELADDELDNVSGGGCHTPEGDLLVGIGHECDLWICQNCGRPFDGDHDHYCSVLKKTIQSECQHCKYAQGQVNGPKTFFFCGCIHPDKVK